MAHLISDYNEAFNKCTPERKKEILDCISCFAVSAIWLVLVLFSLWLFC